LKIHLKESKDSPKPKGIDRREKTEVHLRRKTHTSEQSEIPMQNTGISWSKLQNKQE